MSKLTLQLSPEMDQVLDDLAQSRDLPKAQVLRRAVLIMKYLDEQAEAGKEILSRDPESGDATKLVFESEMGGRRAG